MTMRVHKGAATAAVFVLLGLGGASCSETGGGFDLARLIKPPGTPQAPAPAPNSPAGVLRLLEWSYNNRSLATYRELFTADFRWICGSSDSAGAEWRGTPWTRDDEIIFATHLFVSGGANAPAPASVRLTLDQNLFVYPDPYSMAWDPLGRWHKRIRTTVNLRIELEDGGTVEILGHASFYVVRGDSALIPEELRQRGFRPDSTRWYIRRLEDETAQSGDLSGPSPSREVPAAARRPVALDAQASRKASWCSLRALYH